MQDVSRRVWSCHSSCARLALFLKVAVCLGPDNSALKLDESNERAACLEIKQVGRGASLEDEPNKASASASRKSHREKGP